MAIFLMVFLLSLLIILVLVLAILQVGVDVSPTGSVSSTSDANTHSSGRPAMHNSGGIIYKNVTSSGRRGGGWSTFGSGSSSHGGGLRQSTTSSTSSNASAFRRDEQFGLRSRQMSSGEKDVNKLSSVPVTTWSNGASGSSRGGGVRQSTASSTFSHDSAFRRDEQSGLRSGQMSYGDKDVNILSSEPVKNGSNGASEPSPFNLDRTFMESLDHRPDVSGGSVPVKGCSEVKIPESADSLLGNENSMCPVVKFDLCPPRKSDLVTLKPNVLSKNREKRKEKECSADGPNIEILRPGMALLKKYLSTIEQADILKLCRHHGLETVHFEQPSFDEVSKMHLKLMCFGKYWNCRTKQYTDVRPIDDAKPPPIPQTFLDLVNRAIKDSQSFISENTRTRNVESILPSVKPDICLVNYYSTTGRLGLHQDKGESQGSLYKGIPIVSFSIGDSAEFLYGDTRDAVKADRLILESGDVLIFGGKSRHIFHGVTQIISDTAPKTLIEETNFRAGRLNITFRQRL